MTTMPDNSTALAAAPDAPIPYLQRLRTYYQALGYGAPYEWAHYAEVPFHPLQKPLAQSRLALITTAAPYQADKGDQGPGAPYNAAAKFYRVYAHSMDGEPDLRIAHVAIDRQHTKAEDLAAYFPLKALRQSLEQGRIGSLAPRFYGLPTNRSQRVTLELDAPELLALCQADAVDAAILVPNCPVCHQSVSLAARLLEDNGISTVIMACAKDIVEYIGVPRLLFSDFPLGNAAGRPFDEASQTLNLALAMELLASAPAPRTTVQSPLRWSDNSDWKLDYANIERLSATEIAHRRAEFDQGKQQAKQLRQQARQAQAVPSPSS